MPQCAVLNCNNTHRKTKGYSVRYHRFPGDPGTRLGWLRACGRHVQNCATARICSLHFSETSYERDVPHELLGLPTRCRLKKGAVPEVNIPRVPARMIRDDFSSHHRGSNIAVLLAVGLMPALQAINKPNGGLPRDLNKMHVMEDIREGSDVPSAQPSSPGHAEHHPTLDKSNNNNNENKEEENASPADPRGDEEGVPVKTDVQQEEEAPKEDAAKDQEGDLLKGEPENHTEDPGSVPEKDTESPAEDGGSNDSAPEESPYPKRKLDGDESPSTKRMKSELEQEFAIRDKILNEYMEGSGCATVHQLQMQMDQILSEIRTLNDLAKEKEKEWNNIIHLKKMKEELLLRIQRRKQIMMLDHEASPEPQSEERLEDRLRRSKQGKGMSDGGLMIFSTLGEKGKQKSLLAKQYSNATTIEINGGQSGDPKQNRQRPTLDVQTIIADYRQRHPEVVPRRGRRIRSLLNSQGGAQTKHGLNTGGMDANSELSLLLTAVDNAKHSGSKLTIDGQPHMETASFKDVLMQFAKLSKHERQDLLQSAMKPPPYSEVTVHPVPVHTQSSNSLLHGILTKTQSSRTPENSKSTFSPTLARLLTAPERAAAGSPHSNNNHTTVTPVSISDMLSNNKARNEITITPVGGQFDLGIKEKSNNTEEEEAEDSADRLVIDESEVLDGRSRMDNGSDDVGDEVPQCQGCNQKPAQFVCAGCGNQWYCSRECQVVAWDEHSEVCSG